MFEAWPLFTLRLHSTASRSVVSCRLHHAAAKRDSNTLRAQSSADTAQLQQMVRFKNRYFVLYVKAKDGRTHETIGSALAPAIRSSILQQRGEAALEAALPSLAVPYYHHFAGVAIVRVARSEHEKVLQDCLKLSLVDYKAVNVKLLKLTGAFRVAKTAAAEHIARLMAQLKLNPEQQASAVVLAEVVLWLQVQHFGTWDFRALAASTTGSTLLMEHAYPFSHSMSDVGCQCQHAEYCGLRTYDVFSTPASGPGADRLYMTCHPGARQSMHH